MSDCRVPMDSLPAGQVISKLNERNRRLCVVARDMYRCLMTMPSGWEDETYHIKHFKDELKDLGAL